MEIISTYLIRYYVAMKYNQNYLGQSLAQNPEYGKYLPNMFINRLNYLEVISFSFEYKRQIRYCQFSMLKNKIFEHLQYESMLLKRKK